MLLLLSMVLGNQLYELRKTKKSETNTDKDTVVSNINVHSTLFAFFIIRMRLQGQQYHKYCFEYTIFDHE